MARISQPCRIERVEEILASGADVLVFVIESQDDYLMWWGSEDACWSAEGGDCTENVE